MWSNKEAEEGLIGGGAREGKLEHRRWLLIPRAGVSCGQLPHPRRSQPRSKPSPDAVLEAA